MAGTRSNETTHVATTESTERSSETNYTATSIGNATATTAATTPVPSAPSLVVAVTSSLQRQ